MSLRSFGLVLVLFIAACTQKQADLTPVQIQAKADSIFKAKKSELEKEYARDLEIRSVIEVRQISDSIVRSRTPKDSAVPAAATVPVVSSAPAASTAAPFRLDSIKNNRRAAEAREL